MTSIAYGKNDDVLVDGALAPRRKPLFIALIASLLIALGIYAVLQVTLQERLRDTIRQTSVLEAFCEARPQFLPDTCAPAGEGESGVEAKKAHPTDQLIHALLTASEVLPASEYPDPADLEGATDDVQFIRTALADYLTGSAGDTALAMVEFLTAKQGINEKPEPENKGLLPENAPDLVTASSMLADLRGNDDWLLWARLGVEVCGKEKVTATELGASNLLTARPLPMTTRACYTAADVLRFFMQKAKLDQSSGTDVLGIDTTTYRCNLGSGNLKSIRGTRERCHAMMVGLNRYLLGQLVIAPKVAAVRKWMQALRGPENILIAWITFFAGALLVMRMFAIVTAKHKMSNAQTPGGAWLQRLSSDVRGGGEGAFDAEKALSEGRMILRWAIATVPAIGFIGTVRGILNALSETQKVVWAGDRLERADAIGNLAGELGLAFSTTFFALIAGVLLATIVLVATLWERRQFTHVARKHDLIGRATG